MSDEIRPADVVEGLTGPRLVLSVKLTDLTTGFAGHATVLLDEEAPTLSRHSFADRYAMPTVAKAWAALHERIEGSTVKLVDVSGNGHGS